MTTEAPKKDEKAVAAKRKTLPELLNDPATEERFQKMLGSDARSFAQNILTVFNGSKGLQECEPESIIAACSISASIGLSILPSLGHSCVVPYKDGDRKVAQWQLMYKGGIQLAQRSGRYAKINLARVYEGQLVKHDEFKGEVTLDADKKKSDRVIGYYFFFRLLDGYMHEAYWPVKKCIEHGMRFSKSMQAGNGKWTEDTEFEKAGSVKKWLAQKPGHHFLTEGSGADAMGAKTLVKIDLLKWGPLETRIKETVQDYDQAAIDSTGKRVYIDTTAEPVDEPKKYTVPPTSTAQGPDGEPFPVEKIAWARTAAEKQGVPVEQFDAWLAQQPGDEAAKAEAATEAWKRVAKKEAKAVDVFSVKKEESKAEERTVRIEVSGVASSEFEGNEATAIRDGSEPAVKYFTTNAAVIEQATKIKGKAGKSIEVVVGDRESGGKTFGWIIRLA